MRSVFNKRAYRLMPAGKSVVRAPNYLPKSLGRVIVGKYVFGLNLCISSRGGEKEEGKIAFYEAHIRN